MFGLTLSAARAICRCKGVNHHCHESAETSPPSVTWLGPLNRFGPTAAVTQTGQNLRLVTLALHCKLQPSIPPPFASRPSETTARHVSPTHALTSSTLRVTRADHYQISFKPISRHLCTLSVGIEVSSIRGPGAITKACSATSLEIIIIHCCTVSLTT